MDTIQPPVGPDPYDGTKTCRILIGQTLDLIANKWSVPIILVLAKAEKPLRFSEVGRAIPTITQKELTKQLRELEATGLAGRKVYPEVPPRVEYWLTERGRSLKPVLDALAVWAAENGVALAEARAGKTAAD